MRILLVAILIFSLTSCETNPSKQENVKYYYDQEKVEKPDKVNIYFVRPFNISLMWYGYTAYVGVGTENVGGLSINEKAKIFIDEGLYKITVASNVDALTKLFTSDQTFTTRFEKGKNYYFIIEPSVTKVFIPRPITRAEYLRLTKSDKMKESFVTTLKTVGGILRNMEKFK